jgi:hypothetical protein
MPEVQTETADAADLFNQISDGAQEVTPQEIVDQLIKNQGITFEDARDILFNLINTRQVNLTPKYTIQLPGMTG